MRNTILSAIVFLTSVAANAGTLNCELESGAKWKFGSARFLDDSAMTVLHVNAFGSYLAADLFCTSLGDCVGFVNGIEAKGKAKFDSGNSSVEVTIDPGHSQAPTAKFVCK